MKMNMKFSLILVAAMFSLFIIGFGGVAPAATAGNCAETLVLNVSASESAAFTDCRALQADAARYTGLAAFYTHESNNVQRTFEADAARYSALAASYTHETNNVQRAIEADAVRYTGLAALYTPDVAGTTCLGIASINLTDAELVNCQSDSAYQAANPELMAHRRFVVADASAASQPISVDIETRNHNHYDNLWTARHGN